MKINYFLGTAFLKLGGLLNLVLPRPGVLECFGARVLRLPVQL